VTSKERTADFADFADRGDAAQDCRWRAKSLVRDNAMPAAMLSRSFLSVSSASSASSAAISTLSGRRRLVATAPPPDPKLSGTRRPSPHPDPQSLRGRRRLVTVAPQRGRMTAQIERGAAWSRPVLRPSAWSASLRSLPRSLKAEVWRAEPRRRGPTRDRAKKGPRISRISRIGETPRRTAGGGRSRSSGTTPCLPPCSPALSYPCHPRHPRSYPPSLGAATSRRHCPASRPKTFWDETSQPLPPAGNDPAN